MASILKVDTIQDQAGNNIISKSANVITIGASGDTITVPAGATVSGFTSAGIDDNATSTAITIDSSERVMIGTTDIGYVNQADNLTIGSASGNTGITIRSGTSNNSNIYFSDATGTGGGTFAGALFYQHSDNAMVFYGNSLERMRITNTGKIGINTSAPDDTLHIKGNVYIEDSSPEITFETTGTSKSNWQIAVQENVDQALEISVGSADADASNDTFSPVAVFKNSGNVGIGTVNPAFSSGKGLEIENNGTATLRLQHDGVHGFEIRASSTEAEFVSANSKPFTFDTGGSERVRIDHNSGARLFLGTTSDLSHGAADNNRLIISGHSNNGAGSLGFVDTSGNTDATITANDGSLVITADTQQTSANSSLQFRVDNSEKMRLTSGDRLLINSTTNVSSEYLLIKNNYTRSGMTIKSNTTNPHHAIEFHNTNNQVGSINTNGSSTDYNTSSDYRLKENVNYNFDATSRLKQLKPARFNFIADADKTVDGFLAHEVSDIVPEAIHGTKDAVNEDGSIKPQGIDQSKLVPLLVKTIQELEARITTLEANNP